MSRNSDHDGSMFEQLRPRMKAISTRIVGSEAEAADIVQDCFFKWRDADLGALATPAAWLTTVVRHQSVDRLRRRAREAMAAHSVSELVSETPPAMPDEPLLRGAELVQALARMLACLSPAERVVLTLHEAFGCDHAEIAALLDTKPANARQHLARARRRLREEKQEGGRDPAPDEKLCRDLVRRFQAALDGMDMPAMVALLAGEQPVFVQARLRTAASANDACYRKAACG